MEKKRIHLLISGRVQGIFFRSQAKEKARELGLTGWICNLADGRVEAVIEGNKEKVEEITDWARSGPVLAKIEKIKMKEEEYQGEFKNFEIRY